jgi:hypothetical protein
MSGGRGSGANQISQSDSHNSHTDAPGEVVQSTQKNTDKNQSPLLNQFEKLAGSVGTSKQVSAVQPELKDLSLSDGENNSSNFKTMTSGVGISDSRPKIKLPKFLEKINSSADSNESVSESRSLALASDFSRVQSRPNTPNPNSFSSIFNKDHEEISGIQRVFKKSISFLILSLFCFGGVTLAGVNLFSWSPWVTVFFALLFVPITNIFFIIVADRSYVWLALAGQLIILLLVNSFLGLGFDLITILFSLLIIFMTYLAYGELEKVQLGSRLFSISHITSESARILSTVLVLTICLGVFNSVISRGMENYFTENFLDNPFYYNNLIVGKIPQLSLNRLVVGNFQEFNKENSQATFRDFLVSNYRQGKSVITPAEQNEIINNCTETLGIDKCGNAVTIERDRRLDEFRKEAYPKLSFGLDQVLTKDKYEQVLRQHYLYVIKNFGSNKNSNFLLIPPSYVLPALLTLILYLILTIIKPLFNWIVFVLTWLIWQILRVSGFAKIEVEAVEAEIVSI